jgi:hypothetical protein
MTPERRAQRENETLLSLIGLAVVCALYCAGACFYNYLKNGG